MEYPNTVLKSSERGRLRDFVSEIHGRVPAHYRPLDATVVRTEVDGILSCCYAGIGSTAAAGEPDGLLSGQLTGEIQRSLHAPCGHQRRQPRRAKKHCEFFSLELRLQIIFPPGGNFIVCDKRAIVRHG